MIVTSWLCFVTIEAEYLRKSDKPVDGTLSPNGYVDDATPLLDEETERSDDGTLFSYEPFESDSEDEEEKKEDDREATQPLLSTIAERRRHAGMNVQIPGSSSLPQRNERARRPDTPRWDYLDHRDTHSPNSVATMHVPGGGNGGGGSRVSTIPPPIPPTQHQRATDLSPIGGSPATTPTNDGINSPPGGSAKKL